MPSVAPPTLLNNATRVASVSIRDLMNGKVQQQQTPRADNVTVRPVQPQVEDYKPTDSTSLLTAWRKFAHDLPQEDTAMANRLKDIDPVLLGDDLFEVVANNEIVEKELNAFKPRILQTMRVSLHNGKLDMKVRMRNQEDKQRAYNRVEQFNLMCKNNEALMKLKDMFDLEL